MSKETQTRNKIIHRLKIVRGHISKVIDMVENSEECLAILHQSQAIQKALKAIDKITLENHINSCISDSIKKGKSKASVEELVRIVKQNY